MPATYKCIRALSISSTARGIGMAMLLLAGCSTSDETPAPASRLPGISVDAVSTVGGLQEVEYRNVKSGERYLMRASLGGPDARAGWIESRAAANDSELVKIEWTARSVRVTENKSDGTQHFWYVARQRGIERIDPKKLELLRDRSAAAVPFLLSSATQADTLLGDSKGATAAKLGTPLALAREMIFQGPPGTKLLVADTFPCNPAEQIEGVECPQKATLERNNKDIFEYKDGLWRDENTMKLKCGAADGAIVIEACPPAAYDCKLFKTAKTEIKLDNTAPTDDTSNKNRACVIMEFEDEDASYGKKFDLNGLAELRPGKAVRPKGGLDIAKAPTGCKLEWNFPDASDDVYHSQWADGHANAEDADKLEVELSGDGWPDAPAEQGAIGGKSQISASVHTCQDSQQGDDDYALSIRGTRQSVLYTCAAP